MNNPTHPPTTTRGNGAAVALLLALVAALALVALSLVNPEPLGGVALLALALAAVGLVAGAYGEAVAR